MNPASSLRLLSFILTIKTDRGRRTLLHCLWKWMSPTKSFHSLKVFKTWLLMTAESWYSKQQAMRLRIMAIHPIFWNKSWNSWRVGNLSKVAPSPLGIWMPLVQLYNSSVFLRTGEFLELRDRSVFAVDVQLPRVGSALCGGASSRRGLRTRTSCHGERSRWWNHLTMRGYDEP